MNHSSRIPEDAQAGPRTSPGGAAAAKLGPCRCSSSITSSQTGAAPVTPLTSHMGSPVKLPTHTPTVKRGE